MNLSDPISPPALDEGSSPMIRRAFHRARVVGKFAFVQALVQIIGFMSGILLVRWMPQHEYAYFTIANTMQATINVLADIGISVGLISIGGRVWQDRSRFGELINTALSVRKRLGAVVIIVTVPILCSMLIKNGSSVLYAGILSLLVVAGVSAQLSLGVLSAVPRLRSDIKLIQLVDLTGAIVRFLLLALLMWVFLYASVAVAVAAAMFFLQYIMLRKYAAEVVDLTAPDNSEDRRAIVAFIRKLAANTLFYCFQGQITVFLISFFARNVSSIAEVGALGRLAMIFTVLSNLMTNVFVPAFARCQNPRKLRYLYAAIVGGVGAFSLCVLAAAKIFPDQFLFVLGNKYAHLHHELLLMAGSSVLSAVAGTLWALNASKAWISGSWLYIPLTLATQMALIPITDFSSVPGVLTFNLLSTVPSLLLNAALSYRGFRSLGSVVV